jgi:hypothetical protein
MLAGLTSTQYLGQARPGQHSPRPDLPPQGRDLFSPDYFLHLVSTPMSCVSLGMPLGSDWHILHHYMLVLGRPLAHTSILYISYSQPYPQERIRLVT